MSHETHFEKPRPWPETCRFFVPSIMDYRHTRNLITHDSHFLDPIQDLPEQFNFVTFSETGAIQHEEVWPHLDGAKRLHELLTPEHATKILFVPQKRRYYPAHRMTRFEISLTEEAWLVLLQRLEIPGPVLDVMHDNNGGASSLLSYCSESQCQSPPSAPEDHCAYHIWLKLGDWANFEHFVYVRYDFHTGRNVVLVVGSEGDQLARRMIAQHQGQTVPSVFHILFTMTTAWSRQIEEVRWHLDFDTQEIETQTGHGSFQSRMIKPLAPEQLSLNKKLTTASDHIRGAIYAANSMINVYNFILQQLNRYNDLLGERASQERLIKLKKAKNQLFDAYSRNVNHSTAQILQMNNLKARLEAQWSIITTLVVQRDSRVNIDIAAAAKEDGERMKLIAFVTMIFLPATFMATFFSMVFFNVSTDGLAVNRWIWIYPACTVPLTILLTIQYSFGSIQESGVVRKILNVFYRGERGKEFSSVGVI